jgi:4-hydroxy-3-polyprenylbenzoate decarboxylase
VVALLEAGAIVLPAIPSFYSRPGSVSAVVDTVVWRILDQIGLPSPQTYRWGDEERPVKGAPKKNQRKNKRGTPS